MNDLKYVARAGTLLFGVAALAMPSAALATVTEPNGVVVPGVSSNSSEQTLQQYFTAQGEGINASADASTDPGVFQPLCNFKATLVLSQSGASGGLAWYNVPADPTSIPSAIYPIIAVTSAGGGVVGQVISSGDITTSANYANGFVGFVLTKYLGANNTPVYYSEYLRNQNCTGCTTPGHWKMALAYPSTVTPSAYFLAFEDWEGANSTTWFGNDGDFNDKVFKIEGVTCGGGGVSCDTGQPGICAPGITECQALGQIVCKPQVTSTTEKCDGLDNNCDGNTDEGDLCPAGDICDRGKCVHKCGEVLVTCTADEVCSPAGYCVDAECANVTCTSGQQCVHGVCKAPCDGVACPAPTVCLVGACLDPCAGVSCGAGKVCEKGVCLTSCTCNPCAAGQECAASGHCVAAGCETVTCGAGTVCKAGACVDSCLDAVCPSGQKCQAGACVDACTGVTCPTGQKCLSGTCADSCSGVSCGPGLKCAPGTDNLGTCVDACTGVDCGAGKTCSNGTCGSDCLGVTCPMPEVCQAGACIDPCANLTCASTEVCRGGACVDRCAGVTCPTGQTCQLGVCAGMAPSTGGAAGAGVGGAAGAGGAGTAGLAGTGGVAGSSSGVGGTAAKPHTDHTTQAGCGCRLAGEPPRRSGVPIATVLLLLGALALRRRAEVAS